MRSIFTSGSTCFGVGAASATRGRGFDVRAAFSGAGVTGDDSTLRIFPEVLAASFFEILRLEEEVERTRPDDDVLTDSLFSNRTVKPERPANSLSPCFNAASIINSPFSFVPLRLLRSLTRHPWALHSTAKCLPERKLSSSETSHLGERPTRTM